MSVETGKTAHVILAGHLSRNDAISRTFSDLGYRIQEFMVIINLPTDH